MSFKTIFQDTSAGEAIRQYFDTKFAAIESRLESIERMLGAESKRFLSESAIPSPGMILIEDEPEWRPMSTAPKDRDIKVKLNGEVRIAWYYSKEEWSVSGCVLPESYFEGWRPL